MGCRPSSGVWDRRSHDATSERCAALSRNLLVPGVQSSSLILPFPVQSLHSRYFQLAGLCSAHLVLASQLAYHRQVPQSEQSSPDRPRANQREQHGEKGLSRRLSHTVPADGPRAVFGMELAASLGDSERPQDLVVDSHVPVCHPVPLSPSQLRWITFL